MTAERRAHKGRAKISCERERGAQRILLPIPAFAFLCAVFCVLAALAAEIMPLAEWLSVYPTERESDAVQHGKVTEPPNAPASVNGDGGQTEPVRTVEALQLFLNTGDTVALEKMLHPAHLSILQKSLGRFTAASDGLKISEPLRLLLLRRTATGLCGASAAGENIERVECRLISTENAEENENGRIIDAARRDGASDAYAGIKIRLQIMFLSGEAVLCSAECTLLAFRSECGCRLLPESLLNVIM